MEYGKDVICYDIDIISQFVCDEKGTTDKSLKTQSRVDLLKETRQIIWSLCRDVLGYKYSLDFLGKYVGLNHDHATVSHAIKKVEDIRSTEKKFDEMYMRLFKQCSEKVKLFNSIPTENIDIKSMYVTVCDIKIKLEQFAKLNPALNIYVEAKRRK